MLFEQRKSQRIHEWQDIENRELTFQPVLDKRSRAINKLLRERDSTDQWPTRLHCKDKTTHPDCVHRKAREETEAQMQLQFTPRIEKRSERLQREGRVWD